MKLPRGLDITMTWENGQMMANIHVKRWYIPVLLLRYLRTNTISYRYWPVLFWQYYTRRKAG